MNKFEKEGYDSYNQGDRMIDNPYPKETPEYSAWKEGWRMRWFEHLKED